MGVSEYPGIANEFVILLTDTLATSLDTVISTLAFPEETVSEAVPDITNPDVELSESSDLTASSWARF